MAVNLADIQAGDFVVFDGTGKSKCIAAGNQRRVKEADGTLFVRCAEHGSHSLASLATTTGRISGAAARYRPEDPVKDPAPV